MDNIQHALEQVARNHGVCVEEVVFEIESAIAEAILLAQERNDQVALLLWKTIPCEGIIPTAKELIGYISRRI